MQTNEQYHEEFKPPPEGTTTGMGDDQVVAVDDPSNEQQQVQHRCARTRWLAGSLTGSALASLAPRPLI